MPVVGTGPACAQQVPNLPRKEEAPGQRQSSTGYRPLTFPSVITH